MRQPSAVNEHVGYNRAVREFLQTYHVNPCDNYEPHPMETCLHFHSQHDRRRNPYLEHSFRYYPSAPCPCAHPDCPKTHNAFEDAYHPLKYKTSNCANPGCPLGFLCWGLHPNEYALFQKTQFFRFDLNTFKTEPCPQNIPGSHELSSCRYYHGEGDRRRNPARVSYSHVECPRGSGCGEANCGKTHNKIEQLYHPSRYKTKYCQNFYHRRGCTYQEFCSFAHSDQEIEIELLHLMDQDDNFNHYKYKTVWCPYTQAYALPHAATTVPNAPTRTTSRTSAAVPPSTTTPYARPHSARNLPRVVQRQDRVHRGGRLPAQTHLSPQPRVAGEEIPPRPAQLGVAVQRVGGGERAQRRGEGEEAVHRNSKGHDI